MESGRLLMGRARMLALTVGDIIYHNLSENSTCICCIQSLEVSGHCCVDGASPLTLSCRWEWRWQLGRSLQPTRRTRTFSSWGPPPSLMPASHDRLVRANGAAAPFGVITEFVGGPYPEPSEVVRSCVIASDPSEPKELRLHILQLWLPRVDGQHICSRGHASKVQSVTFKSTSQIPAAPLRRE